MKNFYTYDQIMRFMSNILPEDIDTREGTVANMVMSVTAMAAAQLYEDMKAMSEDCYAATATGECLDMVVALMCMERHQKTNAIVKIESDEGLTVGTRLLGGEAEYEITSVENGYYIAQCTTEGEEGNAYLGDVVTVSDSSVVSARITAIIARGQDTESDEALRERYLERLKSPLCTGNVSYYRSMIHSIPDTGGVKVYPAEEGGGKVRVVITNADCEPASEELIAYVKEYLDPAEYTGMGYGVLPIGHSVEVGTVESVTIDLVVDVNGGVNQNGYMRIARSDLKRKLLEMNKEWHKKDRLVIWNKDIEEYFFTLDGINDVNVISINGSANRFILGENQIIGGLTINGA
ncbi:MAG: baseplate J/gp47 family protein [Clostridia bacterium]|nr:baseplate J/gp47 family protein [Clostridia bacterium]